MRLPEWARDQLWWPLAATVAIAIAIALMAVHEVPVERVEAVGVVAHCNVGDSVTVYPRGRVRLAPGDSLRLTAVCWEDDWIVGCSGACDTIPPERWHPEIRGGAGAKVQL